MSNARNAVQNPNEEDPNEEDTEWANFREGRTYRVKVKIDATQNLRDQCQRLLERVRLLPKNLRPKSIKFEFVLQRDLFFRLEHNVEVRKGVLVVVGRVMRDEEVLVAQALEAQALETLRALTDLSAKWSLDLKAASLRGKISSIGGGGLVSRLFEEWHTSLICLDLHAAWLSTAAEESTLYELLQAVKTNCHLKVLRTWRCYLKDAEMEKLAEALVQSKCRLKLLDLGHNSLTLASMGPISRLLHAHTKLKTLILEENLQLFKFQSPSADPQDLSKLRDTLEHHRSLRCLRVAGCSLDTAAVNFLFGVCTENSVLKVLDIGERMRLFTIHSSWLKHLPLLKRLETLRLPANFDSEPHFSCFKDAIQSNTSLTRLENRYGRPLEPTAAFKPLLYRNMLLKRVQSMKHGTGGLPQCPLWPKLLQKLGGNRGEGSPLFSFFKENAALVSAEAWGMQQRKRKKHGANVCWPEEEMSPLKRQREGL